MFVLSVVFHTRLILVLTERIDDSDSLETRLKHRTKSARSVRRSTHGAWNEQHVCVHLALSKKYFDS
jgi:hypothetical protein